jgi:hypothetical protein
MVKQRARALRFYKAPHPPFFPHTASALLSPHRTRPSFPTPVLFYHEQGLLLHDPALSMGSNLQLTKGCPTVSYVSDEYDRAGVRCGRTLHAGALA